MNAYPTHQMMGTETHPQLVIAGQECRSTLNKSLTLLRTLKSIYMYMYFIYIYIYACIYRYTYGITHI
jgi:hypothetical protein